MFFVFGGALLWWGALGDLMVWGVLAGGGSYVLEGCSSVLGPAVPSSFLLAPPSSSLLLLPLLLMVRPDLGQKNILQEHETLRRPRHPKP